MRLIKTLNKIVKYQYAILFVVAGAYLVAVVLCKAGAKVVKESTSKPCYSNLPFCNEPQDVSIPLAYVSSATVSSATSATLTLSTLSFADAENINIPFV
jgi:hypothetical protein